MKTIEIIAYYIIIITFILIIIENVYEIYKTYKFFKKIERQHEELLKSLEEEK